MTYQYAGDIFDRELRGKITEFTVTEDHIKLAREMNVDWEHTEFGAPAIDGKRPYGDSNVTRDMAEILEIPVPDEGEDLSDELEERLTRIHAEMGVVLQIALVTGEFKAGRYVLPERYSNRWEPAL